MVGLLRNFVQGTEPDYNPTDYRYDPECEAKRPAQPRRPRAVGTSHVKNSLGPSEVEPVDSNAYHDDRTSPARHDFSMYPSSERKLLRRSLQSRSEASSHATKSDTFQRRPRSLLRFTRCLVLLGLDSPHKSRLNSRLPEGETANSLLSRWSQVRVLPRLPIHSITCQKGNKGRGLSMGRKTYWSNAPSESVCLMTTQSHLPNSAVQGWSSPMSR